MSNTRVHLVGAELSKIVNAIPTVEKITGRPVVVVGGLAVLCRVSTPHRSTTDLDTAAHLAAQEVNPLELLLSVGARASGPAGALLPTHLGDVQIDVLTVRDAELAALPDDPTDRLHVTSHAWAVATASLVEILVGDGPPVPVRVAQPGPLVAMKLQAVMNRGRAKEATDLLDITRLVLDRGTRTSLLEQLGTADQQLRADSLMHVNRWFTLQRPRTMRQISSVTGGRSITLDDVGLVGEILASALAD